MSPDDPTIQSLEESTVLASGVKIINNAKHISLEEQKHKFINVKIKIDISRVGFPLPCLALEKI